MIKNRKSGEIVKINCFDCEGKGYNLIKPLNEEAMEDEEKIKENSILCKNCNGTGKIEGIIK